MTHIQHMAQKNDGGPGAVTRRWNGGTDDGERGVVVSGWKVTVATVILFKSLWKDLLKIQKGGMQHSKAES